MATCSESEALQALQERLRIQHTSWQRGYPKEEQEDSYDDIATDALALAAQLVEENTKLALTKVLIPVPIAELQARLAQVEGEMTKERAAAQRLLNGAHAHAVRLEEERDALRHNLALATGATFCRDTGEYAVSGACVTHNGDACLVRPQWAIAKIAELESQLDAMGRVVEAAQHVLHHVDAMNDTDEDWQKLRDALQALREGG